MKPCQMVVMKTELLWEEKGKDTTHIHTGVMQQERGILSCDLLFVQPGSSPDPAQLVTTHCDENIVQDSCLDFSSRGYYFRAAFILFTSNCAATI